MTYYKGKAGDVQHGGSGSYVAAAKAGVKVRNWGKFYSLIEAMQIGFEEPGSRGTFQLEGVFRTRAEALHEIGELERFRKEFQKLVLPRALLDRRFELVVDIRTYHRGSPPLKFYWVKIDFMHLPKDVNSQLPELWRVVVPD